MKKKYTERPLSPHLGIYKLPITAISSISNRIAGVILYISLVLFVWLLAVLFYCDQALGIAIDLLENTAFTLFLKIVSIGISLSLFYHMMIGIRHLFWGMGKGFDVKNAKMITWLIIFGSILFTLLFWVSICILENINGY